VEDPRRMMKNGEQNKNIQYIIEKWEKKMITFSGSLKEENISECVYLKSCKIIF